jgi:ABC-type transport system involved in cytochrome c biogenesis permease subunit
MKKWLPWILVAVCAGGVLSSLRSKPETGFQTREFGQLPILLNGRIQPLDSAARNSLLQIRTKQTVALEHGDSLTAIEWLMEVTMKPEAADERKIFRIDNLELLGMLKLPENEKYFSFNQLHDQYAEINRQAERILTREHDKASAPESRTVFEKQVMKLYGALQLYEGLMISLRPPGSDNFAGDLVDYQKAIAPGVAAVRANEEGKSYDQAAYDRILHFLGIYQQVKQYAYLLTVPPAHPEVSRDDWQNIGASLMETAHGGGVQPAVGYYAMMVSAYRQNDPDAFNQAVRDYQQWLRANLRPEMVKGHQEFIFNGFAPFYQAAFLYVGVFLLSCISLLAFGLWPKASTTIRRSAFALMILTWVLHTAGILFRMHLEGRPPVTNLYSSAVFIGWGVALLCLILEGVFPLAIASAVGSVGGFTTLIIAHNLATAGDTMEMLRAVLDTNFWLATHVVVVTFGYASTFVAGLLAITYIGLGLFTPVLAAPVGKTDVGKILAKMVYAIICFATLFSFTGTVLGGIWADQSWGRFWGWDPKENGALLIVIWNAIILHARWGGIVRDRGVMLLAVFGNIVTSFSWFGVNMLGIGLHSYGFMDAAFRWLLFFVISQAVVMGVGSLPLSAWKSFRKASPPTPPGGGKAPVPVTT